MGHAKRKLVFVVLATSNIHTRLPRLARIFKISNEAVLAFKQSYIWNNNDADWAA